jgi:hypothetical protein
MSGGYLFKKYLKTGVTTPDLENSLIQLHLRKIWGCGAPWKTFSRNY